MWWGEPPEDVEDGVPYPCALSCDNISTLPKALFIERIATLGPERMAQVCKALAKATSC